MDVNRNFCRGYSFNSLFRLPKSIYLILFLVFALYPYSVLTQGWEKTFTDDFGYAKGFDVIETNDGGYVIVGHIDLPTGAIRHYIWAAKTDQDGNELWSHIFNEMDVSYRDAHGVVEMPDGDLLIVGAADFRKAFVLKLNSDGEIQWTNEFGGPGQNNFKDIIKTANDEYILVGSFGAEQNTGLTEIWAMGMNQDGDSLWSMTYGDTASLGTIAMDINGTPNGDFLICGAGQAKGFAANISISGELSWSNDFQNSKSDVFLASTYDQGNNEYLFGASGAGFAGFSPYIARTDTNGNLLGQHFLDSISFGAVADIQSTADGGFLVCGSSYNFWEQNLPDQGFVSKLDPNLETVWQIVFEDSLDIQGAAVKETTDGGVIMAGTKKGGLFLKKIGGGTNAVNGPNLNFEFEFYPNPAESEIKIAVSEIGALSNTTVRIYDVFGRKIMETGINERDPRIDISTLRPGLYNLQLFQKGMTSVSKPIIKRN